MWYVYSKIVTSSDNSFNARGNHISRGASAPTSVWWLLKILHNSLKRSSSLRKSLVGTRHLVSHDAGIWPKTR